MAISGVAASDYTLYAFLIIYFSGKVNPLQLSALTIPSHAALGSRPELTCLWKLGQSDRLYSVKWYKDGREFFRYVPKDPQPKRQYPQPGVTVEEADDTGSKLILGEVSLESAGRYRCEVSGERPLFPTVSDHADMEVVALPSEGPTISGSKSRYSIGDKVLVTCKSGRSLPAAKLSWFINGEPAPAEAVSLPITRRYEDGLESTQLELDFKLKPKHFRKGDLKIKCLATIASVYWKSNEESVEAVKRRDYTSTRQQRADLLHAGQSSRTAGGTKTRGIAATVIAAYLLLGVLR